jgi:hypothetical protein
MSRADKYLQGQNYVKRYKLGATAASVYPGIPYIMVATTGNVGPCTATSATDAIGMATGPASVAYSTSQATILANGEGVVDIDINPGLVYESVLSGTAADGGALIVYTNTSASAGGTVLTATVPSTDWDGGVLARMVNGVAGEWRTITTHTSTTSLTVTVPFSTAIAVGDTFVVSPYNETGNGAAGGDGNSNLTLTTLLTQADATVASGGGFDVVVVDLELRGTDNSLVRWCMGDHIFANTATI